MATAVIRSNTLCIATAADFHNRKSNWTGAGMGGTQMNLNVLRSTLCLLSMSVLFTDGAIAQPSDPLSVMDARAKFANGYAACVKYSKENSNSSLATVRLGELETALIEVNTDTKGNVTECSVVK